MNAPSILFLAHSDSIHTKKWVEHFINRGWAVTIISFQRSKIAGANLIYLNAGKINVRGGNYKYLFKLIHVIYYIWKIRPDIVNCHYLSSYGILGYLSFYTNMTVTLYGSDVFLYSKKNRLYSYLTRKIFQKAQLIFSVSNGMTDFIKNNFQIEGKKIITKQYGIDLTTFSCKNLDADRKYTFITNRSFVENSNYNLILDVMKLISVQLKNFVLLIVGSGPLKSQIKAKINDLAIEDHVILKDAVNHETMVKFLNESLIYISFTSSDGTPLSVFEAAACGAYPLLSDIPPNREWLEKGLRGHCVSLDNNVNVVEIILGLITNLNRTDFMMKNISFINDQMDYKTNMKYIEEQFLNLIQID